MQNNLYKNIVSSALKGKKMLAVLLDPDKCGDELLANVHEQFAKAVPDFIFIGGSSKSCNTTQLIEQLQEIPSPKVLFPGDASQFSPNADALLFLSLLSGENPEYLIGQHRTSAREVKNSGIEVIPTAYLLIDGGNSSSAQLLSRTAPIASSNSEKIISTTVAGELLGMKLVYLEAGSGARNPIPAQLISSVKKELDIPLIVGGGVRTETQLQTALDAGADIVVVGNIFETEPEKIEQFVRFVERHNQALNK